MSDFDEYDEQGVITGTPEDSFPINTTPHQEESVEPQAAVQEQPEPERKFHNDSDLLQHSLEVIGEYLEASRHQGFSVNVLYADLKLFYEATQLAIARTDEINTVAKAFNARMELIQSNAAKISEISKVRLQNEKD
jgi:hypothetical protein